MLLDQEGFECDPINKREGDTPLHSAVRWANEVSEDQKEFASSLIEMMLEAGSDPRFVIFIPHQYMNAFPLSERCYGSQNETDSSWLYRIRNKAKLKPLDLVDPRNSSLRNLMQESEYVLQNQGDFIDADAEEDEGPTGSNSDSDFEAEEVNGRRRK